MSKEKLIDYLLVLPSISLYFLITEKIFSCSKSEGASMVNILKLVTNNIRLKYTFNRLISI